ncbi:MAG: serine hydrolase domain-containing protein [Alphaproteobacteria bacterium]
MARGYGRGAALAIALLAVPAAADVCPGARWEMAAPAAAGWSEERLRAADAIARAMDTDGYLVASGGRVVWTYGAVDVPGNLHSVRKSIASLLFGIAADRGQVPRDRTLADLGIDDVGGLSEVERKATVRDVLAARACVFHPAAYETETQRTTRPARGSCAPGERWHYNNWDFNAAGTIYQRLTGRTLFDAFEDEIARPLAFAHFRKGEHTRFHREDASVHPAYLFRLSALDMARIGLLMARGGDWCGRRIVSTAWIEESTAAISATDRLHAAYGYMWWVGEDGRQLGGVFGSKAFSARGARGQFILVHPASDLVIVHRVDTDVRGRQVRGADFAQLVRTILSARR